MSKKFTPTEGYTLLEAPVVEKKTNKGLEKPEAAVQAERDNWIKNGNPVTISRTFHKGYKDGDKVLVTGAVIDVSIDDVDYYIIRDHQILGKFE